MDYITVREASEKWSISERRVQRLCQENRIEGACRFGRVWMVPQDAKKPLDWRSRENKNK